MLDQYENQEMLGELSLSDLMESNCSLDNRNKKWIREEILTKLKDQDEFDADSSVTALMETEFLDDDQKESLIVLAEVALQKDQARFR